MTTVGQGGLLIAVLALPLLGASVLALTPRGHDRAARVFGAGVAALTFVASLGLLSNRHDPRPGAVIDPWHSVDAPWVPALGLRFHIGVDGISAPLVVLTTLLFALCAAYSVWHIPGEGSPRTFFALLLVLQAGILGAFVALDVVVFFVAFEVTLLPMYALIARWGGEGRRAASTKFVLYTLAGSVLLLVGVLIVAGGAGTSDLVALSAGNHLARGTQILAFVILVLAFAVKSPLWPLHTWLPDAHTEAPTVGSVILAGVLLKMGTYGLLRIAVPVLPQGARALAPTVAVFAAVAIIVGAFCCLVQTDLKRLIAYSSVGHMGFVLLGIATLSTVGMQAAVIGNVAHGLITGLLFFLVGGIKDRYATGRLADLSGLGWRLPVLAGVLGTTAVASLGMPGLAGFWGELFAVVGAWQRRSGGLSPLWTVCAILAAVGGALAAAYFLRLLRLVVPGRPRGVVAEREPRAITGDEWLAWAPLLVLIFVVGFLPGVVLDLSLGPVQALVAAVSR